MCVGCSANTFSNACVLTEDFALTLHQQLVFI